MVTFVSQVGLKDLVASPSGCPFAAAVIYNSLEERCHAVLLSTAQSWGKTVMSYPGSLSARAGFWIVVW